MSRLQRFSYAWYAHAFLRELILIYPTSAIMMTGSGITPLELSSLFIIWGLSVLIAEIPTGALADLTSRRNILVISGLMNGCAFLIWLLIPSYVGFAAGYIVWGTGSAMASGAGEALLYDTLKAEDETQQFARIYSRGKALNNLGIALALLIGGYAAEGGFDLPLVASVLTPWSAGLLVLFTMREPPRDSSRSSDGTRGFADTLRQALTELRRNRVVGYLVLMFGVLATLYGAIEEYFAVYLDDRGGLSLTSIGAIYALAYAARTVGLELAHRLPGPPVPNAVRLLIVAGLVLATTVFASGWWLALPIALYSAGAAIAGVLLQTRLQHAIEGDTRATVTSAVGVVEGIFEFPLYLSIGLVAQFAGWQAAFTLIATLTVVGSLGFRWFAPRNALD
jgi:predicted MFS family arabinose efflux permease